MINHSEAFTQAYDFSLKTNGNFPAWLLASKAEAWEKFIELGLPSRKDESWKYSKLGFAKDNLFEVADGPTNHNNCLNAIESYAGQDEIKMVFVNDVLDATLSDLNLVSETGLKITPLKNAFESKSSDLSDIMNQFSLCFDRTASFTSLNQALAVEGLFVQVKNSCHIERTIHIIHIEDVKQDQTATASFPYNYISLQKGSSLKIRETFVSLNDMHTGSIDSKSQQERSATARHFRHQTSDVLLEQDAHLTYISTQALANGSQHIGHLRVIQDSASHFDGHSLAAGASFSRQDVEIWQRGEQAEAHMNGLYAAKGENHCEQRCALHHRAPNCRSTQLYKGIVNDTARIVFLGEVNVAKDAQKIAAAQLNKNLILSNKAEADTKPQLVIDADDVKCSHGATVAQLREEEIFYFESRGIPRVKAKKLLVEAFANELVARLPDEGARKTWAFYLSEFFKETRKE